MELRRINTLYAITRLIQTSGKLCPFVLSLLGNFQFIKEAKSLLYQWFLVYWLIQERKTKSREKKKPPGEGHSQSHDRNSWVVLALNTFYYLSGERTSHAPYPIRPRGPWLLFLYDLLVHFIPYTYLGGTVECCFRQTSIITTYVGKQKSLNRSFYYKISNIPAYGFKLTFI